jgi:hypothetical protein
MIPESFIKTSSIRNGGRVLLLVTALSILSFGCGIFPPRSPSETPSLFPSATSVPPTGRLTPPSSATASPTIETLDPEVVLRMEEIEGQVIQLRGLHPTFPTQRELLTAEELQEEILDGLAQDYSPQEAEDDARVLAMLGLLDPGFDLWQLYLDLYTEQILGFYDDATEQMSILADADFDILERVTYAHEYVHALQDQSYDFQDVLHFDDAACEANGDRCLAIQALLEGDATLLQSQWLRTYASLADIGALLALNAGIETPAFTAAPEFIQESFLFPYDQGGSFVLHFYMRGQWAEVDNLYRNPPASTEQLLHPTHYPDDVPIILDLPELTGVLPSEWREIDRSTLGEWQLSKMLSQFLPAATVDLAAFGWGGDSYLALYDEANDREAIVLVTAWDTNSDATHFYNAMREYGNARFSNAEFSWDLMSWQAEGVYVSLVRSTRQVMWIMAPDSAIEGLLREAITIPMQQR